MSPTRCITTSTSGETFENILFTFWAHYDKSEDQYKNILLNKISGKVVKSIWKALLKEIYKIAMIMFDDVLWVTHSIL